MLVLYETAAGFALFKVNNEKVLKNVDNLHEQFSTAEKAGKIVELSDFHKFKDSAEALEASVAINEGSMSKSLKSLLKKTMKKELHNKLMVLDTKLGASIKAKIPDLEIVCNSSVNELIRCIRGQMDSLIPGISEKESSAMMLGLGHNLARYKLKFSPDKVDTMVIQAINLMGDLDKELNNYVMRVKEWYGWHFPELAKILTDNTSYVHTILKMGFREDAKHTNFDGVVSDELAQRVKEAAEVSMGSEMGPNDLVAIQGLGQQIVDFTEYRASLAEYLDQRMNTLAPNLHTLVGELIGARLVAHTGSLINLAKTPASTVQLIGAEKALFRALKTKSNTPKYGLIYHADLVNQASAKNKGKMSRMLANKAVLCARADALGEDVDTSLATLHQQKLIKSLARLQDTNKDIGFKISGNKKSQPGKHIAESHRAGPAYEAGLDSTVGSKRERDADTSVDQPKKKKMKKEEAVVDETPMDTETPKKRKKKDKKNKTLEVEPKEEEPEPVVSEKKKKKKKDKKEKDE